MDKQEQEVTDMTVYTVLNLCLYVAVTGIAVLAYGYAKERRQRN